MKQDRWLRIIPVALIMYTISYIDRTNISLALDPNISHMMRDLMMDDRLKGEAAGIFFLGYVLLQIPGGYLANRWSPKKLVSIFLVLWGLCAVGCGLATTFKQFEVMRFLLGVAESGVFPATLVLLANWFPRSERARANAYWNLCQPLAVAVSAPLTGWLLGKWGWKQMLIIEGAFPFIWLPLWWYYISDRPSEARWISEEEKQHLEKVLAAEKAALDVAKPGPLWKALLQPAVFVMVPIYFLQNCAAYGCNTFLTSALKNGTHHFTASQTGWLFAIPYAVTAVIMVLNSWHSDKKQERRGHVAFAYGLSGVCLIISVWLHQEYFWPSYAFLCVAISGPFSGLAPFWAIPAETLPRYSMGAVMGLVNAMGNIGGYVGPSVVGYLSLKYNGRIQIPFSALGGCLILAAGMAFLLPKSKRHIEAAPVH